MPESLRLDAFASQPHYADHIRPIWDALDADGDFFVAPSAQRPGTVTRGLMASEVPVLVAGYPDLRRVKRPVVFIEHGIGENYNLTDPHYSGGKGRDDVLLFLCPNRRVYEANESRYPGRSVIVGSPRLESLIQRIPVRVPIGSPRSGGSASGRLRVAVSFHWNCRVHPQAQTALFDFQKDFPYWASRTDIEVKGHAHPRIASRAERIFGGAGIEFMPRFGDVMEWCDVYAVDNSSTLFEAAAFGKDVVVLDASSYTPEETGFRFWRYADIGPRIDARGDLPDAAIRAVAERTRYAGLRHRMVAEVFGATEGATKRAVAAIRTVLNDDPRSQSGTPPADTRPDQTQSSLFG